MMVIEHNPAIFNACGKKIKEKKRRKENKTKRGCCDTSLKMVLNRI